VLLIELDGLHDGMEEIASQIADIARQHQAREVRVARDDRERNCSGSVKRAFGAGTDQPKLLCSGWCHPAHVPEVLRHIREISARYGIRIANVFHAGDGNLPLLLFDERDSSSVSECCKPVKRSSASAAVGSLSGEHGIGIEKREDMPLVLLSWIWLPCRKCGRCSTPESVIGKVFPTPGRCVELGPRSRKGH
jgi:glycolate oxidase